MNCKPGDLAVVIGGTNPLNIGCFVNVLKPSHLSGFFGISDMLWEVEPVSPIVNFLGVPISDFGIADDHILRPIRDSDGQDESLTWAGKPQQINSPELVK